MKRVVRRVLVPVVLIAAVIGVGLWLGRRDAASKTPCQRYAELLDRELDNCHSGMSRDLEQRALECEQSIDPTPACFDRIEALSCEELERGPVVTAGEACRPGR